MKRRIEMIVVMMAMAVVCGAAGADVSDVVDEPTRHWHEIDTDWMDTFHEPLEGLEMGLDLRLRNVYARNILTLNDSFGGAENWNNYHWQRYRTRWFTRWHLDEDITFNTRLVWEFWTHCRPRSHPSGFFGQRSTDFDEAMFDHFNIQFRNAFDMPLTITAGRQDIILGTGWLVLDGTPADGSRTIHFDAALRATYEMSDVSRLDLVYLHNYDSPTKFIKPFNHGAVSDRRHQTQGEDERGAIVYLTHEMTDMTGLDAYYIFKRERQSARGAQRDKGQDAEVNTFGARLYGALDENWTYSAEGAFQFGYARQREPELEPSRNQRGLGTNNMLTYSFHDDHSNELRVGYEYLSGDSGHGTNTQFNSLWGDWPQFQRGGDLQAYMWAFEYKGIGNVGNLHRAGVGHSFKPHQDWTLKTDYNLMWADRNTFDSTTPGPLTFSDSGNFRGQMLSALASYRCCPKFGMHFLVDYFIPDNYYGPDNRDNALFARVNLEWTF